MIFKLILFSFLYISILLFIAPIIDHLFTELDESESNYTILGEIILQITCVAIIWYYLHKFLKKIVKTKFHIIMREPSENLMDFISAIVLVGLQKNLVHKLEYITYEHPFRIHF
jgi:hypothetical protein